MNYIMYYDVGNMLADGWYNNNKLSIPPNGGYYKEAIEANSIEELKSKIIHFFQEWWGDEYTPTIRCCNWNSNDIILSEQDIFFDI